MTVADEATATTSWGTRVWDKGRKWHQCPWDFPAAEPTASPLPFCCRLRGGAAALPHAAFQRRPCAERPAPWAGHAGALGAPVPPPSPLRPLVLLRVHSPNKQRQIPTTQLHLE